MKDSIRNALVYAIGILALVVAIISIVVAGVEIAGQIKDVESLLSLTNTNLYSSVIELVFAGMELFMGVDLIKKWRNKEHFEVQKSISQLISAIVYASMLQVFMFAILSAIIQDTASVINISTVYIILSVVFTIFISSIGSHVKKHQLMNILITMLITSLIAIGFGVYECVISFMDEVSVVDGFVMFGNLILVALVLTFECFSIAYYKENPLVLEGIARENEDVDVIKQTDDYEVVKIYTTRAKEGSVNVWNTIIYMLACAFFVVGIVLFAKEKNVSELFAGSLGGFINRIKNIIYSGSISRIMDILCMFMFLIIYPLVLLSFIDGVIRRKANQKTSVTFFTSAGVTILTFSSFSLILDAYMDFTISHTFDLANYSILQIAMLLINVAYMFVSKIFTNIQKNINSGISGGDSYQSHSKGVAKITLFGGLFSCLCYVALFLNSYLDLQTISLVYLFFIIATILFMIGTFVESKHPYSEFSIVKRKIIKLDEEKTEVVAVPVGNCDN